MAYADLIDNEGIRSEYLVVLKPSIVMDTFVLFSGSVYSKPFTFGQVIFVTENGNALTEAFTTSLAVGEFYYDIDALVLYVRMSDASNPSTKFVVGIYEIYAATSAEHFNRVPDDSSTRNVFYNAFISTAPIIKNTQNDGLIGYLPVQTTNIVLINAEHDFEQHIYASSFNKNAIEVYHWLDTLQTNNVKLILSGTMGNVSYSSRSVSIQVKDRIDLLDTEYRNASTSFYAESAFPDLDPNFQGRPIRYVYGRVDGFIPVNLSYEITTPTTATNRVWGVRSDKTKLNTIVATVIASPVSTTTRVYLNTVVGFSVGDGIRIDKATDESSFVTAVGANYIDISPALISGVPVTSDVVTRPTISRVSIIQNNIKYDALYIRDFTINTTLTNDVLGFDFTSSAESNLGIPSVISPNDRVFCRVYGKTNDVTLGGPAFGSDDSLTANLTGVAPVLVDLFKRLLPESYLDSSSFSALNAATTEALGFSIPEKSRQDFPKYKDIISDIIQTILLRIILNNDSQFSVKLVAPMGAQDKTIDDTEIINASVNYSFSYSDIISLTRIEYSYREQAENNSTSGEGVSSVVNYTSNTALYLHGVSKQKTYKSLHFKESEAQILANHLGYIFGDRQGNLTVVTKNRFFDTLISDTIEVSRYALPGFEYIKTTLRDRSFSVLSSSKGLRSISLELDDQKGIQDADTRGDW